MRPAILYTIFLALILAGCASPKDTGLAGFPENEALYKACTSFYDFLVYKELDMYHDQPGIRRFFPNRESYYDFLDTIIPAMRDRNFERHRILSYIINEIVLEDTGNATVRVKFTSDDVLPFGKVMTVDHEWHRGVSGWYPGKIDAPKATRWEKLR